MLAPQLIVRHVCVPDYRVELFRRLSELNPGLVVMGGDEYFSPTIRNGAAGETWWARRGGRFFVRRRLVWLERMRMRIDAQTVVIHEWNPRIVSFWMDLLICRRRGARMIVWGHAWGKRGPNGLMFFLRHWMSRRADAVICYTETQADLTRQIDRGVLVAAAPNACMSRDDCGVSGEEARRDAIVFVGRLVPAKKPRLLIEGFAAACRQDPGFRAKLVIVGEGPERVRLESRLHDLGLADRVLWLGHQSDVAKLRSVYERAFVSVSPGYVGLSLTQSFAFGVPALIARDEPHSPEIEAARDGWSSYYFASDDPTDLGSKMLNAWQEWRGIEGKRRELAAWTAENYSFEKMAERISATVHSIASGRK